MIFVYTYRDNSGCIISATVKAETRAHALDVLKRNGVSVITIESKTGKIGSSNHSIVNSYIRQIKGLPYLVIGLLLIVGCVICIAILRSKHTPIAIHQVNNRHQDISTTPRLPPKTIPTKKHTGGTFVATKEPVKTVKVLPPKLESQDIISLRDLKREWAGTPIFKHDSENMIAGILAAIPGERFVDENVDPGFDRDLMNCINEPIEIFEDDPDDIKEQKVAVDKVKKQLASCIEQGEAPSLIISDLIKGLNEIADYRDQLNDALRLMLRECSSEEELSEFVAEANGLLREYNAIEINVSPRQLERFRTRLATENVRKSF